MKKINTSIVIGVLIVLFIGLYIYNSYESFIGKNTGAPIMNNDMGTVGGGGGEPHQCGMGCNSLDPLTDPVYNIKSIISQSILLEEHLAIPSKRCRQCIFKHLYHCKALAEEGIWLATNHPNDYPLLIDSAPFYSKIIDEFTKIEMSDEEVLQDTLEKLRNHRKKLVEIYVLGDGSGTDGGSGGSDGGSCSKNH